MCLPLIARVLAVAGDQAEVELQAGERAKVNRIIQPDVSPGQTVLVDRGMIVEVIAPEQLPELLELYAVLAQSWEEADEEVADD